MTSSIPYACAQILVPRKTDFPVPGPRPPGSQLIDSLEGRARAARIASKESPRNEPMFHPTEDLRIQWTKVVLPPVFLEEELPVTEAASATIFNARNEIICDPQRPRRPPARPRRSLLHSRPQGRPRVRRACSKRAIDEFAADLRIVMRVYFEKPRTTIGWKGLINDPHLDGTYKINDGLRLARHLLLDLAEMGVPTGTEFLDMISPQYIAGLVSWGAIGARTTESQVHRQLVSGVSCPVGFKNATSGDVQVAIDAVLSAAYSHTFLGHTQHGQSAIFVTTGNPDCHIILRGGRNSVNYTADCVAETAALMQKAGVAAPHHDRLQPRQQPARTTAARPSSATTSPRKSPPGNRNIIGVMIESNLVAGAQKLVPGQPLVYGQSITDACIDWTETRTLLAELAAAVRARRQMNGSQSAAI